MKLTILGSGTHYPSLVRSAAGYLLENKKKYYLFDIGPGTIRRLLEAGVDYRKIRHIFITHLHGDHVADLFHLLFTLKVQYSTGEIGKAGMDIFGPKGIKKFFNALDNQVVNLRNPIFSFPFRIREMTKENINAGNLKVKWAKVKHGSQQAVSYRLESGGKSIVYSGDLEYGQEIIKLSRNADLLILECSRPEQLPSRSHLTAAECGRIAAEAGVKKLVLSHLYPITEKYDIIKQAKKYFKGPVVRAKDLMEIRV